VLDREQTLLVLSLSQLQRFAIAARTPQAVTYQMDLLHLVEWLHDFSAAHRLYLMVRHHNHVAVAVDGRVSTTRMGHDLPVWRLRYAACASVWWLQNPSKPFEALTTATSCIDR
jgi:hypothetical protein